MSSIAAVALFKQTVLFVPTYSDILLSNSFVRGPVVIHPDSIASLTSSTSSKLISGGENGISLISTDFPPNKKARIN